MVRFHPLIMALLTIALLAGVAWLIPEARADDDKDEKDREKSESEEEDKDKDEKLPKVDEVTKGMKLQGIGEKGFLRVYQDKSKLYIEVPRSHDGKEFFLATSFAGGNSYHGWQWSDDLVSWERFEKKLLLVRKDTRYRATEGSPVSEAVKRTYSDQIVLSLKIKGEARGSGRGYLIDGKKLFAKQAEKFFGRTVRNLDTSIVKWDKVKVFEDNVEIAVTMPDRRSGRLITLHYSLARLPKSDYQPRVADPRVGYFLTAFKDFSKGKVGDDLFVRYVNRWNLKKQDDSLKLSPPKRPIVFYIEKTVPVRYRRYVREGILEWNRAFEKIGFDGAIEVRQQTDSQFADLDPEDSSLNFFRWITSERAFAMGPSRVNPRTGEIVDADVIFDDSMARSFLRRYEQMLRNMPQTLFTPRMQRYFADHPDDHPYAGLDLVWDDGPEAEANPGFIERRLGAFPAADRAYCNYGNGIAHEMALIGVAAMVQQKAESFADLPEEYIGPVIREVVMHEIGHTLGLRHNFKASTWKTLQEINEAGVGDATVASVMDYTPVNIVPSGKQQQYMTGTIGPYDYWAIEYGYSAGKSDDDLKAIASRGADEGLDYGTDEDVGTGDPTINRYDHSSDPLAYAHQRLELVRTLLPGLTSRLVEDGQGYQAVRRAFGMLLFEMSRSAHQASNYIGGAYVHRDYRGDPGERPPIVVVPAAKQREALRLITSQILAEGSIHLDPELLTHLAAGRWSHWGSRDFSSQLNYPVLERVLSVHSVALSLVLNPQTLGRVRNCELKVTEGEESLTIPEIFDTLTGAVFSEVATGQNVSAIRQNLQRTYVDRLIRMTLRHRSGPSITQSLARTELEEIKGLIEGMKGQQTDAYTTAHLKDTLRRIDQTLEAQSLTQ